jgi:hypothetical protein
MSRLWLVVASHAAVLVGVAVGHAVSCRSPSGLCHSVIEFDWLIVALIKGAVVRFSSGFLWCAALRDESV